MGLRRSLLFVPAEARKIDKARAAGADTLIFDLEDAIAPQRKEAARRELAAAVRAGGFGESEVAVRVNGCTTAFFRPDIEAMIGAGVQTVMIPKADGRDVSRAAEVLDGIERSLEIFGDRRARILALAETAAGIAHVESFAASPRVAAVCFGHADFARDMGLADADAGQGIAYHARCQVVILARACGAAAIDSVFLDVEDDEGFRADAGVGLRLGYEGKLCIHPRQVALANEVYTPTRVQIDYALRVTAAAAEAQTNGQGVFTLDGRMVDAPLIAVQERVLERARRAGVI